MTIARLAAVICQSGMETMSVVTIEVQTRLAFWIMQHLPGSRCCLPTFSCWHGTTTTNRCAWNVCHVSHRRSISMSCRTDNGLIIVLSLTRVLRASHPSYQILIWLLPTYQGGFLPRHG